MQKKVFLKYVQWFTCFRCYTKILKRLVNIAKKETIITLTE